MKTKRKVIYIAPLTQTLNVVQEGVICTSNPTPTYNNPFDGGNEDW